MNSTNKIYNKTLKSVRESGTNTHPKRDNTYPDYRHKQIRRSDVGRERGVTHYPSYTSQQPTNGDQPSHKTDPRKHPAKLIQTKEPRVKTNMEQTVYPRVNWSDSAI